MAAPSISTRKTQIPMRWQNYGLSSLTATPRRPKSGVSFSVEQKELREKPLDHLRQIVWFLLIGFWSAVVVTLVWVIMKAATG